VFETLTDRFSVIDLPAPDGRHEGRLHRWEKPMALAEHLLRLAGPDVKRVIDPFAGTGTFLLAAAAAGAEAWGCDRDPAMVAVCEARGVAGARSHRDVQSGGTP
jgi:DNA modification methylase